MPFTIGKRFVVALLVIAVFVTCQSALTQAAIVVRSQPVGAGAANGLAFGQSVTTPTGGPWNNLTFNFYSAPNTPTAFGSLFVLTQAYAGLPSSLSNATPGFLASTSTINSNVWSFASNVTINPNTQYFFYTNSANPGGYLNLGGDPYTGGQLYFASGGNYTLSATFDASFDLSGTIVAVPEPSSMALLGVALSGVGLRCWRTRKRS